MDARHSRGRVLIKLVPHEGVNAIAAEKEIRTGNSAIVKRDMDDVVSLCDLNSLSAIHHRELARILVRFQSIKKSRMKGSSEDPSAFISPCKIARRDVLWVMGTL